MKLYLIRHAAAVPRDPGLDDALRSLTARGRGHFRAVAERLNKKGVEPELVLTSPYLRTVQTAEILAAVLDYRGEVEICRELEPGAAPAVLRRVLAALAEKSVVLVGHAPDLGELAADLAELPEPLTLKKGDAVALDVDFSGERPPRLRWITQHGRLVTAAEAGRPS